MDTKYLKTVFSAFADTVRAVISEEPQPGISGPGQLSPDGIRYYNSIAKSFNEVFSDKKLMLFREDTTPNLVTHPKALEVLGQVKIALSTLGDINDEIEPLETKRHGKPKVFIGCSVEGFNAAKIIQLNLEHSINSTIWHQRVFGLSKGTLETLVEKVKSFDYAILVLTQDDVIISRGDVKMTARDNVLFELGLFMGALGRSYTFIVCEEGITLPSDLAGITPAHYSLEGKENLVAALGPVCTKLEIEIGVL
ncbi:TIR domain-containing protein [Celerinatantimonas yamalensis]|uniref:Nucleotide-binding protein n=1 Tax=Celerinatantimonas yamalensis TaxID=559956 RepID=A0ABW9G4P6_9GAMM